MSDNFDYSNNCYSKIYCIIYAYMSRECLLIDVYVRHTYG